MRGFFCKSETLLQGNNLNLYGCFDVSVQLNNNFVLAGVTQNVAHADLALGNSNAGSSDGFSHVTGTDGTEQLAFIARFGGDDNSSQFTQLGSALFSGSFTGSQFGFQFSTASIESLDVGLGSHNGFALRDQIVTGVASFNSDLITQTAQFGDFVEQDNLHYLSSIKVELGLSAGPILTCCADRCTAAEPGNEHA